MSASLNALLTQLTWKQNEVTAQLTTAEQEQQSLTQHIEEINFKLVQSSSSPLVINPEVEINRMNFMMQLQQQKDQIQNQLKVKQELVNTLQQKTQRIKTELKMLERYLIRKEQLAQQEQRKTEEQSVEEWILQRRKTA